LQVETGKNKGKKDSSKEKNFKKPKKLKPPGRMKKGKK